MPQDPVNPAPHAGEKEPSDVQDGKDATSPASKPQGTLQDQVQTMESEGQAQPQSDERPPEDRPKGKDPRR